MITNTSRTVFSCLVKRRLRFPLFVVAVTTLLLPALTQCAPAPKSGPVVGVNGSTASFLDSIGVNIHTIYNDTPYGDGPRVVSLVASLGAKHVRDALVVNRAADQVPVLIGLAARGVKSTLLVGDPAVPTRTGSVSDKIAELTGPLNGAVDAVEGANEWDCSGRASWPQELRADQARWRSALKADPATARLILAGPSFCRGASPAVFGAHPESMDVGSFHPYAGGGIPEGTIQTGMSTARQDAGNLPLWATEVGYNIATSDTKASQPAVSESQAAVYLLRSFLENYRLGVQRTYAYELFDEFSDPAKTNMEADFGLVRHDGIVKPAYAALQSMISTLKATSNGGTSREGLAYTIANAPADLHQLLLDSGDGQHVLVLWRAAQVAPTAPPSPDTNAPQVTVQLKQPVSGSMSWPSRAGSAAKPVPTATTISVPVSGEPVVLKLKTGSNPVL